MSRRAGAQTPGEIVHPFAPVFDSRSRILILGSLPSVSSRETQFYYGHPRNRFWPLLSALTERPLPQSVAEKKEFLLQNGIALWDVVARCEICGSADSTIRRAVPNDLSLLLDAAPIRALFANGSAAFTLYRRLCEPVYGRPIRSLPSTSPANAACSWEALLSGWAAVREALRES